MLICMKRGGLGKRLVLSLNRYMVTIMIHLIAHLDWQTGYAQGPDFSCEPGNARFGQKRHNKSSWELHMQLRLYTYKHSDALLEESRLSILLQPVYSSGMLHLYFLLYHILYSHLWVDQSYSTLLVLNASTI